MNTTIKKIIWIIIILLILIGVYGFSLGTKAKSVCKNECKELGTEFYDTIKNGKFDTHDLCVCYLENEIKTFIINERKNGIL